MSVRTKKLLGTVALLVLITVYSLLVMVFAVTWLPRVGSKLGELLFYAVAGLAWVPVAAVIVSWMYGTPKNGPADRPPLA